jgi:nucleotide-binding universal stress UspA family protein
MVIPLAVSLYEYSVMADKDHDILREEAREFMRQIQEKSAEYDSDRKVLFLSTPPPLDSHTTDQLSLILEYIPGRITDTLDRLIALYRPDSVVVGTRGRRTWQTMGVGFGMGSVSQYVSLFPLLFAAF